MCFSGETCCLRGCEGVAIRPSLWYNLRYGLYKRFFYNTSPAARQTFSLCRRLRMLAYHPKPLLLLSSRDDCKVSASPHVSAQEGESPATRRGSWRDPKPAWTPEPMEADAGSTKSEDWPAEPYPSPARNPCSSTAVPPLAWEPHRASRVRISNCKLAGYSILNTYSIGWAEAGGIAGVLCRTLRQQSRRGVN